MSVIVELSLPPDAFELGQILRVDSDARLSLETMVPLGERPVPFVRATNDTPESFAERVRAHEAVRGFSVVTRAADQTLYALDWAPSEGTLFEALVERDVTLLRGSGGASGWEFQLRFPSHEELSAFQTSYLEEDIGVNVERIYHPTDSDSHPRYGLTDPQRETLLFAVENGYYSLPRSISTKELASEFDISDQAATERLRRGIATLVEQTLAGTDEES